MIDTAHFDIEQKGTPYIPTKTWNLLGQDSFIFICRKNRRFFYILYTINPQDGGGMGNTNFVNLKW